MKRKPWFKFDPSAWLNDVELRSCSSAARGTLIDLMCIAHNAEPYGYCMPDIKIDTRKKVAKAISLSLRTFDNHLLILLRMKRICLSGVDHMSIRCMSDDCHMQDICASYDSKVYIKRMVEDHSYSLGQSKFGKTGGNPTLKGSLKVEENREEERRKDNIENDDVKRFVKPTSEQLSEYAKSISFSGFNPMAFLSHYQSKGWMIGKNRMKDWRGAVRTWKINDEKRKGKGPRQKRMTLDQVNA